MVTNPTPLCTRGLFPVGMPLPTGVSLLHDYSSIFTVFTPSLIANDTAVFLNNIDSIHRLNLADNSDKTLATAMSSGAGNGVRSIAIDDTNLYFTESGSLSRGVAKVPLDGSAAPTILLAASNLGPVAVSNGYVYFELASPSGPPMPAIVRVPTTGGATTTLVNLPGFINSLLVVGNYVYFTYTKGSNVLVERVPVTAQAPSTDGGASGDAGANPDASDAGGNPNVPPNAELVATTTSVWSPVSDGTRLIWGAADQVVTLPLPGGSPTQIGSAPAPTDPLTPSPTIEFVATTGGFVYWSWLPICSDIRKVAIDGTQSTTLVHSVSLDALAVNSTTAFFIAGSGQLLSIGR